MPGTALNSRMEEQTGWTWPCLHVASVVYRRQTITGQLQGRVINLSTLGKFSSLWFPGFFFSPSVSKMRKFKKINSQNILSFQNPNQSVGQSHHQTFLLTLFPGLDRALVPFVLKVTARHRLTQVKHSLTVEVPDERYRL